MKRTIYLTENDIHEMVLETISELSINEGKFGSTMALLGALGAFGLGANYMQNNTSDDTTPHTVFSNNMEQNTKNDANTVQYSPEVNQPKVKKAKEAMNTVADIGYRPSKQLIKYIKTYETMHHGWQDDGYGNPTTGWGTKQTPELLKKYPRGVYKESDADRLLLDYINETAAEFAEATPNIELLPQHVKDALYDLRYNIGINKYRNSSKLMAALEDYKRTKDLKPIIANMRYCKANGKVSKGLQSRSSDRQEMASKGDYTRMPV